MLDASPSKVGLVYGWMGPGRRRQRPSDPELPQHRGGRHIRELSALSIPGPTIVLLIRSSVVREVGGMDENLLRHDDVDLICRVLRSYHAAVLPEVVPGPTSITATHGRGTIASGTCPPPPTFCEAT